MAMKWLPASSAPTASFISLKKNCLRMLGSSVEPDLLATTTSVSARLTSLRAAMTCSGSVESTMRSSGKLGLLAKGHGQHLGAEAGAAHAQQQNRLEVGGLHLRAQRGKNGQVLLLALDNVDPAQPIFLAVAGP